MSNLEKKVNALIRLNLAETEEERTAAAQELDALMHGKEEIAPVDNLTVEIHQVLKELGVPYGILGHKYLVDAIKVAIHNRETIHCMTKGHGIYGLVAEMNDTTASRAERAIRHAIESGWNRTDMDVNAQYFGGTIHPDKGKPTNREYIANVAQVVRQRMCEV